MTGTNYTIGAVVVLFALVAITPGVAATSPGVGTTSPVGPGSIVEVGNENVQPSCEDALEELQAFSNSTALSQYTEFEVMRSQTVSNLQTGSCTEMKAEAGQHVVGVLTSFERAYATSEDGDPATALDVANQTSDNVSELRQLDREEYALLSEVALERFYTDLGEQVAADARETERTPDRIEQFRLAQEAYRRAGAANRFSSLAAEVETQATEYESDLETIENTSTTAEKFQSNCEVCDDPVAAAQSGLGVFGTFQSARSADAGLSTAVELSENHGLSDRASALREQNGAVSESVFTLAAGAVILVVGYAAVLGLAGALVASRLLKWERDLQAARVDDIVVPTRGWSE